MVNATKHGISILHSKKHGISLVNAKQHGFTMILVMHPNNIVPRTCGGNKIQYFHGKCPKTWSYHSIPSKFQGINMINAQQHCFTMVLHP